PRTPAARAGSHRARPRAAPDTRSGSRRSLVSPDVTSTGRELPCPRPALWLPRPLAAGQDCPSTERSPWLCSGAHSAGLAQLVEHKLPKLGVTGSNPVSRSEKKARFGTAANPIGYLSGYLNPGGRRYPGQCGDARGGRSRPLVDHPFSRLCRSFAALRGLWSINHAHWVPAARSRASSRGRACPRAALVHRGTARGVSERRLVRSV